MKEHDYHPDTFSYYFSYYAGPIIQLLQLLFCCLILLMFIKIVYKFLKYLIIKTEYIKMKNNYGRNNK